MDPNKDSKSNKPENHEEDFFSYAKANAKDMIAYVLMVLGLILMFFNTLYGGLLIGIVSGLYFSREIVKLWAEREAFLDRHGLVHCVILGGLILGLFIAAPAIFIGAALVIVLKLLLMADEGKK